MLNIRVPVDWEVAVIDTEQGDSREVSLHNYINYNYLLKKALNTFINLSIRKVQGAEESHLKFKMRMNNFN